MYLIPALIVLSLVLHHGCSFPHKTINSVIGVEIMQEFHLLFSLPLIILMGGKKKKILYSIKHRNLKRKEQCFKFS